MHERREGHDDDVTEANTQTLVDPLGGAVDPPTINDGQAWPAVGGKIRAGTVIDDRYRVERFLGAGGMGQVVEATHIELERVVAVKVLHSEWSRDDDSARRFVREGRVVATLTNEHVVRIFDLGRTAEGAPYIVMERLFGKDLGAVLAEKKRLPIDEAVLYVMQASLALSEAHDHEIVHRDVKPQNLFLAQRGADLAPIIKVLDFGLAKNLTLTGDTTDENGGAAPGHHSKLTGVHMLLGSPHFMSPEQIRDARQVDLRTDVWSLGATLFQLLCGEPPFVAKNLHLVCAAILNGPPPRSVRELRPDVPIEVDMIVKRCLSRSPEERFASAHILAEELKKALAKIRQSNAAKTTAPMMTSPARPEPPVVINSVATKVSAGIEVPPPSQSSSSSSLMNAPTELAAPTPAALPMAPPPAATVRTRDRDLHESSSQSQAKTRLLVALVALLSVVSVIGFVMWRRAVNASSVQEPPSVASSSLTPVAPTASTTLPIAVDTAPTASSSSPTASTSASAAVSAKKPPVSTLKRAPGMPGAAPATPPSSSAAPKASVNPLLTFP